MPMHYKVHYVLINRNSVPQPIGALSEHNAGSMRKLLFLPIPRYVLERAGVKQAHLRVQSKTNSVGICVNLFQALQQDSTLCS